MEQTEMLDQHGGLTPGAGGDPHQRALDACADLGFPSGFVAWLRMNWPIWDEFVKLADQMRLKGRAYYSARAVIHVLRWHRHLKDATTEEFKINNNQSARMARLYNALLGREFFRTRGD